MVYVIKHFQRAPSYLRLSTIEAYPYREGMSDQPSPATVEEAHALSRRLLEVGELARRDFAAMAEEFGLTPLQARAVLLLEDSRPMGAIAEHLQCDASNVTGLADRLERTGAIERVAGADRRVKLLSLTREGHALRERLAERVAAGSTVTAKLDRAEREQLASLLDKLLAE